MACLPVCALQGTPGTIVEVLPPGRQHILHHGRWLLRALRCRFALVAGCKEGVQRQGGHERYVCLQPMLHRHVVPLALHVEGMWQRLHHKRISFQKGNGNM